MNEDKIYNEFHMFSEHFTVEDCATTRYALYHEGMFVAELKSLDPNEAYAAAEVYCCSYMDPYSLY